MVVVNSLATTASWTSGVFATSSTALPAGSFTITDRQRRDGNDNYGRNRNAVGRGQPDQRRQPWPDRERGDGRDRARVWPLSPNYFGQRGKFHCQPGSAGFGFTQSATGANASLTVDGINISSASNTVTGAVSGLTFNLLSADPGVAGEPRRNAGYVVRPPPRSISS